MPKTPALLVATVLPSRDAPADTRHVRAAWRDLTGAREEGER